MLTAVLLVMTVLLDIGTEVSGSLDDPELDIRSDTDLSLTLDDFELETSLEVLCFYPFVICLEEIRRE